MPESLEQIIRRLAAGRCEYCLIPEAAFRFKHVLDHITARQHGGPTQLANLALCCHRCNQFKGPNLTGIDPQSGEITRLFHPRQEVWTDHFRYEEAILVGLTPIGRTTIAVLAINEPLRIAARQTLIEAGVSF
jgi:hypothetical protein